jgi:hypothetical protein
MPEGGCMRGAVGLTNRLKKIKFGLFFGLEGNWPIISRVEETH